MSDRILDDRRNALEEAFFAQQNEMLRRRLQEGDAATQRRQALAQASGITDEAVLARMEAMGVNASTVAALTLAPLVLVAWADGEISESEKGAVLAQAAKAGIHHSDPAGALLDGWLRQKPGAEMAASWKAYVHALVEPMAPEQRQRLRDDILGQARAVADATGGFLGLGRRISAQEQKVLDELSAAFG
jgi:tellurite resistance protein